MSELTTAMTEREARRLTERIRITAHNYTEAKAKLLTLVQEAKDGNVHEVLGYKSWTAYLAETLGDEPMRLARDERQEMVRVLSAEGMSTRAIAPVLGVTHKTVVKDSQAIRGDVVPEVPPAIEKHGEAIAQPPKTITGMDGKAYTRPEPKEAPKPRAEAVTSQFSGAIADLNRLLDRFHRITTSPNYPANKNQVATLHGSDLTRAISELKTIADALN